MSESEHHDYLLGTHDAEIERLGLQHRVWRPWVLEAWRRAGITEGSRVIDAGAGPGWATFDLAEMVGSAGRVHAFERSERFFAHITGQVAARGLSQVEAVELDLVTDPLPVERADAFWIRWVLAFVDDPQAVLAKLARALKPGGVAVIHEYWDWGVFRFAPEIDALREFRDFVMADWRKSGGEPDIARALPDLAPAAGLRIREVRPIVEVIGPGNYMWRWPASFIDVYVERLAAEGKRDAAWAERVRAGLAEAERRPGMLMSTPMLLEVIAEKA
jgi:SAM-dependent methyltransferase